MSQETDKEKDTPVEKQNGAEPSQIGSELARAFQDLAKGERTASALENQLDGIEGRINQLLTSMESEYSHRPFNGEPSIEKPASDPKVGTK